MKSAAMFHPEPLSMLLSTVALVLAARMLVRSDYRLLLVAALGLALGLGQLVRAWTLGTLGVVVLVLLVAAVTRPPGAPTAARARSRSSRRRDPRPALWYGHQLRQYDSALFGQPHPAEPVWSRRPVGFFVDSGLPRRPDVAVSAVVLESVRAHRVHRGVGRLLRRLAVAPGARPALGRHSPRARDHVDRRLAVHARGGGRLARAPRPRRPTSRRAPPSVSSSRSCRSSPSRASCTSGRRTRRPTATR